MVEEEEDPHGHPLVACAIACCFLTITIVTYYYYVNYYYNCNPTVLCATRSCTVLL